MSYGYIARVFDVLELLMQQPRTVSEIADLTGYKRQTIYKYMLHAVQHGIAYVHEVREPPPRGGQPVTVYAVRARSSHGSRQSRVDSVVEVIR
jgi:predicted transcriptional regulator